MRNGADLVLQAAQELIGYERQYLPVAVIRTASNLIL